MDKRAPSAITAIRLGVAPLLIMLVLEGMWLHGAALFLLLVFTDFLDGYLAKRYSAASKRGAYFDATTDFILTFSLLLTFGPEGFYAEWIPVLVAGIFAFFVLTSIAFGRTYDPVGKHYGSMLYGVVCLRFFITGELFCGLVTSGILAFSTASMLSRTFFLMKGRDAQDAPKRLYVSAE
ncbi:MAG TPA: CDP-alcohol phosphatidyltransferase family protein [Candidatus Methanomethylicus sp.]|nr:CDP-alcohol phosphatidyltransferase family protein [Candidatus Methanomethylicus sp.]